MSIARSKELMKQAKTMFQAVPVKMEEILKSIPPRQQYVDYAWNVFAVSNTNKKNVRNFCLFKGKGGQVTWEVLATGFLMMQGSINYRHRYLFGPHILNYRSMKVEHKTYSKYRSYA